MRILGVIPARGGSKGVPRKNVALLAGVPLLAYTARAALGSAALTRTILTTDSPEIADLGRSLGLDVPFLRPAELAGDDTPTVPVLQHALAEAHKTDQPYDALCLLQPTCPLRTAAMIDQACELFEAREADTVLSVLPIPHPHHPQWALLTVECGLLQWAADQDQPPPRRQLLPRAWHREGSIYITRAELIAGRGTLYGERIVPFPVDPARSVNIDLPEDFARAETLLTRQTQP